MAARWQGRWQGRFLLALGALAAWTATATGESEVIDTAKLAKLHRKADADGDGKLSMEELISFGHEVEIATAVEHMEKHLLELADRDQDGFITEDEYIADFNVPEEALAGEVPDEFDARTKEIERRKFRACDKDKDGKLTATEANGLFHPELSREVTMVHVAVTIEQKDRDGNGKLTKEELRPGSRNPADEAANEGPGHEHEHQEDVDMSPPPPDGFEDHLPYSPIDVQSIDFEQADQDGDGELSEKELFDSEWRNGFVHISMRELLEVADKDDDGQLSVDELEACGAHLLETSGNAHHHLRGWISHHEL